MTKKLEELFDVAPADELDITAEENITKHKTNPTIFLLMLSTPIKQIFSSIQIQYCSKYNLE